MKKGYIRLLSACTMLLTVSIANCFFNIFSNYTFILFLFVFSMGAYFAFGFEKDRELYKKDVLLNIIIYSISYFLLTYLAGFIIGFTGNGYSLSSVNILKHTLPKIVIILLTEIIRYIIISKGRTYKSVLILICIAFVMLDIILLIPIWELHISAKLVEFIITMIFPSIAKNILLTYLVYKVGYRPAVLYRLIFEVPIYFLPIFPNFGMYISTLLQIFFPAFVTYRVYCSFEKIKNKKIIGKPKFNYLGKAVVISVNVILLLVIALVSGWFKYFAVVVGSNSMRHAVNKGDVVIVKKLKDNEIKNLQEGEILAFRHNEKIVIHRIIKTEEIHNERCFYTKGDNNDAEDSFVVTKERVVGIVRSKIQFIGWPTVWLSELINR